MSFFYLLPPPTDIKLIFKVGIKLRKKKKKNFASNKKKVFKKDLWKQEIDRLINFSYLNN